MVMEHNIKVINYAGDLDSYTELNLIGPFEDEDERDMELSRLRGIREIRGIYEFQPTEDSLSTEDAYVVNPENLVDAIDEESFDDTFWQ